MTAKLDDIDHMHSISSFTVSIYDRGYTSWSFHSDASKLPLSLTDYPVLSELNPLNEKWFNGDVVSVSDNKCTLVSSVYKTQQHIPGVLILEGNKTYGRTPNNKRLYYKCIPYDSGLPAFLIPYNAPVGFSKVQVNNYVTFHFDNWNGKHPYGILTETLGSVDNLEAFYEYQLYCHHLNISIANLTKTTQSMLKECSVDDYITRIIQNPDFQMEDRQAEYVFSIDPSGSVDFDDAFSIQTTEDNNYRVSVYIANVFVWLETLGLWFEMTDRPSTIYLPDRKRTMLPTKLSDELCSLQENQIRFALAMDIIIDRNGSIVAEHPPKYRNTAIRVKRNFVYEEPSLLKNPHYNTLYALSKLMDPNINDSHDVVAHFMVLMNAKVGDYMKTREIGIFRSAAFTNPVDITKKIHGLTSETSRLIHSWNNTTTQYTTFNPDTRIQHDLMGLDAYVHITSPIRRLVDLLNQIILCKSVGIVTSLSVGAETFVMEWLSEMDYINYRMKSIRKVQIDCELLTRCVNTPEIMDIPHMGIVIDKGKQTDTLYSYTVYIEDIKMMSRVSTEVDYALYTKVNCKLYLFQDEDKVRNKIRTVIL
jgi:exoribonuclease R